MTNEDDRHTKSRNGCETWYVSIVNLTQLEQLCTLLPFNIVKQQASPRSLRRSFSAMVSMFLYSARTWAALLTLPRHLQ